MDDEHLVKMLSASKGREKSEQSLYFVSMCLLSQRQQKSKGK